MALRDVEMALGVSFPELFHAIYDSGMMDYLLHPKERTGDRPARGKNAAQREDFFGEGMGDCRLLAFEDLPSARDELSVCLHFDLGIYPERQSLNPLYRIIPFARKISGDLYCFLYTEGENEPKILVYEHDTGDVDLWADNFEEFLYFQIVEEAADKGRGIRSDDMQAHIQWLSDAHKRLLAERPISDIWAQLPEPQEFYIWTC